MVSKNCAASLFFFLFVYIVNLRGALILIFHLICFWCERWSWRCSYMYWLSFLKLRFHFSAKFVLYLFSKTVYHYVHSFICFCRHLKMEVKRELLSKFLAFFFWYDLFLFKVDLISTKHHEYICRCRFFKVFHPFRDSFKCFRLSDIIHN